MSEVTYGVSAGVPTPQSDETPAEDLTCPECATEGENTVFQTPQGLAAHRRRVHNVEVTRTTSGLQTGTDEKQPEAKAASEFACEECAAAGETRVFASAHALGTHRKMKHGVNGASKQNKSRPARRETKKQEEAKKSVEPKKGSARPLLECPTCGKKVRGQGALGAHMRKHGVVGTSKDAVRAREDRIAAGQTLRRPSGETAKAAEPVVSAVAADTFDAVSLNEREFAAYRLGLLHSASLAMEKFEPIEQRLINDEIKHREAQLRS